MNEYRVPSPEAKAAGEGADRLLSPEVMRLLQAPETQDALAVILKRLPQIADMTEQAASLYETAQTLARDDIFREDLKGGIHDTLGPLIRMVRSTAAAAIEAKDAAQASDKPVGLFDLIRMFKDPQTQAALRFAAAFLQIAGAAHRQETAH